MIVLRDFRVGDEPYLRRVFESAIHDVAIRDYSQAEVDAWAPRQFNPSLWARRVQGIAPFVVERDGEIVAYADVQPNGYIALHCREGQFHAVFRFVSTGSRP
jgi:putative acetyltransferase